MPRVSTNTAAAMMSNLLPFTTNGALSADWDGQGRYVVRSYSSAIAVVNPDTNTVHLNTARYSVTTSKHQSLVAYAVEILPMDLIMIDNPADFEAITGHRARAVGANIERSVA